MKQKHLEFKVTDCSLPTMVLFVSPYRQAYILDKLEVCCRATHRSQLVRHINVI